MMKTTTLLLSMLLLASIGYAENISVTQNVSINITCGMEQCVITGPGLLGFYPSTNSTQTYQFPNTFTYQNVTVQNLTIIQNVSNITVITQVINVSQCNATDLKVNTDDLTTSITASIVNVCTTACAPGQAQKDSFDIDIRNAQEAERNCQLEKAGVQTQLDIIKNTTEIRLEVLNQTLSVELESVKQDQQPLWILIIVAGATLVAVLGTIVYRGRRGTDNHGPVAANDLPEMKE